MTSPDRLQHIFYENEIPPEVEITLEKIYQSPFCVTKYFEIFRNVRNLSALNISGGETRPQHVLAYIISGKEITVLNELVEVEQEYLQYFADTVFHRYPAITTVNFNCIKSSIVDMQYPWRRWKTSQDIVITLPNSFDKYRLSLSEHTRKNIKYYSSRLQKKYDDFSFHLSTTHEIDPAEIGKIIEMNRLRMQSKNIRSGFTSLLEKRIIEFSRFYGLVTTINLQGRVVAGTICYEVGNQAYMEIISHHPDFDKDRVGQVCLYLTVKHMIEKGRDSFHMLWGENEYKYRFLGVKQELCFISMYRSYPSKLSSTPKLIKHTCSNIFRQLDYLTKKYIINRLRKRS